VFFYIIRPMPQPQDQFAASIASEAVEVLEDHLLFPGGYLLPLSARGAEAWELIRAAATGHGHSAFTIHATGLDSTTIAIVLARS